MGEGDGQNNLWPDLIAHPNYDEFWQSRDIRRHLNNVNCAVLSVGGWYDAEDHSDHSQHSTRQPHAILTTKRLLLCRAVGTRSMVWGGLTTPGMFVLL